MEVDLAFEGGGAKGIVLVGALQALARRRYEAGRVVGTSAGAITATLLAAGYSPSEMLEAISERMDGRPRFATFLDTPRGFSAAEIEAARLTTLLNVDLPFVLAGAGHRVGRTIVETLLGVPEFRQVFSFVERGGLYAGDAFIAWLKERLNANGRGFAEATLGQLFASTGRHLTVIATDTGRNAMLVLNHLTAPDLPVAMAVRMSMSIPFLWQEVRWDPAWGAYCGSDGVHGTTVVDGGALSNFPLRLLLSGDSEVTRLMGPPSGRRAFGLLIDESLAPEDFVAQKGVLKDFAMILAKAVMGSETAQRARRLVDTMMTAHDRMIIHEYRAYVCRLPARGYGTTEFDMSADKQALLVAAGDAAMDLFLGRIPS